MSWGRVERSKKEEAALDAALKAIPFVRSIEGECAGCRRQLPYGYLSTVTKWRSVEYSTTSQALRVVKPVEMYCRQCVAPSAGTFRRRKALPPVGAQEEQEEPMEDLKAIAVKIWPHLSKETPHSSKWLASKAGIDYTPGIKASLKKLLHAEKVTFEEGKWLKA